MFSAPTHKQQHQPQAWAGRVIRVHDSCLRRWPSSSRLPKNTQPKTTEQGLRESQCAVISKVRNIAKKTDQVYPSSNRCFTEMQNNFTFSRLQKDCTTGSFRASLLGPGDGAAHEPSCALPPARPGFRPPKRHWHLQQRLQIYRSISSCFTFFTLKSNLNNLPDKHTYGS